MFEYFAQYVLVGRQYGGGRQVISAAAAPAHPRLDTPPRVFTCTPNPLISNSDELFNNNILYKSNDYRIRKIQRNQNYLFKILSGAN